MLLFVFHVTIQDATGDSWPESVMAATPALALKAACLKQRPSGERVVSVDREPLWVIKNGERRWLSGMADELAAEIIAERERASITTSERAA